MTIEGFGLNTTEFGKDKQFRVQNELIKWKEQTGTVIGFMPGTELVDRSTPDYLVVQWDDGHTGGISPKKARKL